MRVIDCTVAVHPGMAVWPGDPAAKRDLLHAMANGAGANVSVLSLGVHAGTHVDAPFHFVADGAGVDVLSLEALVGPAAVVDIPGTGHIDAATLDAAHMPAGATRVLLRTVNSRHARMRTPAFDEGFAGVTPDGAAWLVAHGVRLVGVDYLSVEPYGGGGETHRTLLGAGVVVVEGCDLTEVAPGAYWLVCAPLKLQGSDGAPARVLLLDGTPGE